MRREILVTDRDGVRPKSVIIHPAGALGDTLLAYPALAALRAWAPRARITLAARSPYGALALSAGIVDRVTDRDGFALDAGTAGPGVTPDGPDLAVIWSSAYRDVARRMAERGTSAIVAPPFPYDHRHQARYLLDCLRPLGIPRTLTQAPVPILPPLSSIEQALLDCNAPTVLLHPGAGSRWKQWPLPSWLALAEALRARGAAVRWSYGPDDEEVRDALLSLRPSTRADLWPLQPLTRFAALLGQCAVFVSSDTGTAHLAALLRTPQVTLFGPTDPRRWRPISRFVALVQAPDLCGGQWDPLAEDSDSPPRLRRCADLAGSGCPCLEALTVDTVVANALRILDRPSAVR